MRVGELRMGLNHSLYPPTRITLYHVFILRRCKREKLVKTSTGWLLLIRSTRGQGNAGRNAVCPSKYPAQCSRQRIAKSSLKQCPSIRPPHQPPGLLTCCRDRRFQDRRRLDAILASTINHTVHGLPGPLRSCMKVRPPQHVAALRLNASTRRRQRITMLACCVSVPALSAS